MALFKFNSPILGAQRFMVKTRKRRRTKASLRSSPLKEMSEPRKKNQHAAMPNSRRILESLTLMDYGFLPS